MKILAWEKSSCKCGDRNNCFCPEFRLGNTESEDYKKISILKDMFSPSPEGEIKRGVKISVDRLEELGFYVYVSTNAQPFPEAVAFQKGLWREDGRYGGGITETVCNIFLGPPKMRGLVFTVEVLQDGDIFRKNIWA